jgi:hypothetical protein
MSKRRNTGDNKGRMGRNMRTCERRKIKGTCGASRPPFTTQPHETDRSGRVSVAVLMLGRWWVPISTTISLNLVRVLRGIPQSLQSNAATISQSGHDRCLRNPFQFIFHSIILRYIVYITEDTVTTPSPT